MKYIFTKPNIKVTKVIFTNEKRTYFNEKGQATELRLGVGDQTHLTCRILRKRIRKAIRMAKKHDLSEVQFNAKDFLCTELDCNRELGRLVAENIGKANYDYTAFFTNGEHIPTNLERVYISGADAAFKEGVKKGETVVQYVNLCRDFSNAPGGHMTPTLLARKVKELAKDLPVYVSVYDKDDAEEFGMGLLLAVDKGAEEHLRFIVMEYFGAEDKNEKPLVLVGKGVTFDSGGINLKPAGGGLEEMKHDMTGGAAVIAAHLAIAALGVKKNVVTLVPAVENAISGGAYRPGDVLTAMNGMTVEVLNTDAEGRLILADALTYAEQYDPELVVDVATLTGASRVALGLYASVLMTKDESLERKMRELGEVSGDYVWPLPLWDEYKPQMKGHVADLANIATQGDPRLGGAILAGTFLSYFTSKYPWVHIDMAPRTTSAAGDHLSKGATGEPVRLLVRLAESLQ